MEVAYAPQLLHLFVTIPLYNELCNPAALCKSINLLFLMTFCIVLENMCPILWSMSTYSINAVIVDIDERLQNQGKSLVDFPGMSIPIHTRSPYEEALIIQRELDYNVDEQLAIVVHDVPSLNSDQLSVFISIMTAVNDSEQYPKIFFVDGPGGTGKTFLYNTLLAQISLGLASSGIAALLLAGRRTVHSRLKVPIDINELSVCNISKQIALAQLIKRTKPLVWDVACMSNMQVAECVDRSLRDICSRDLPFGDKVMVLGGDFRQIPPVVKHGSRALVISTCLNRSYLWRYVKLRNN